MRDRSCIYCLIAGAAMLSLYGCPGINWLETYRYDEQDPFDLYVLYELLEARPEGLTLLRDSSDLGRLDGLTGTNYIYVGNTPYYSEAAVTALLDYVERGNTAFLAAGTMPEDLAYHLFGDGCYYGEAFDDYGGGYSTNERFPAVMLDTAVAYRYPSGESFHLVDIRYWKPHQTNHRTINSRLLCDPALDNQVMGVLDTGGTNFLRLGWGEGNFFLHTNPEYFTNWFMVDTLQYRYPEAMLSVISEGPIYWDEYHRRYRQARNPGGGSAAQRKYTGGRNLLSGNETLRYIQERPALALAWYSLFVGALLFVIFRGRRRQRIIPILPVRENSSRRFIHTVSRLIHKKGNHAALARRELASLRFHLLHHRGVRWTEGQPPPADLQLQLGLTPEVVEQALSQIRLVSAGKPMLEGDLIRFYRAIEPLYGD